MEIYPKPPSVNPPYSPDISEPSLYDQIGTLSGFSTHSLQTIYDANGNLTQAKELDSNGNTVSEADVTYNVDGTVNTTTEIINGKTMVTTLNYVNGVLSTTNPYTRSVS